MPVDVSEGAGRGRAAGVEAAAERILELLGCGDCELSVVLTGDQAVRALNRQWRGKDAATDVLSFGQLDDAPEKRVRAAARAPKAGTHLGDVVISVDTALRQAAESAGLTFVDVSRAFSGIADSTTIRLAAWDEHPNPKGHELLADEFYKALKPQLHAAGPLAQPELSKP